MASIMPMPISADVFRPDWVLVVLLYWCLALPTKVNVITAWIMGFLLDVLLGSVLGLHAAAMALSVYIVAGNFQKIRNFSVWQQALIVGVISALYHLLVFWFQRFFNRCSFPAKLFVSSYYHYHFMALGILVTSKIRRHFKIK